MTGLAIDSMSACKQLIAYATPRDRLHVVRYSVHRLDQIERLLRHAATLFGTCSKMLVLKRLKGVELGHGLPVAVGAVLVGVAVVAVVGVVAGVEAAVAAVAFEREIHRAASAQ
jgi:hypothetical protein